MIGIQLQTKTKPINGAWVANEQEILSKARSNNSHLLVIENDLGRPLPIELDGQSLVLEDN